MKRAGGDATVVFQVLELDPAALHAASSFGRAAPTQSTSQQWQELQQHGAGLAPAGHRRGTKRGHPEHQPTLTEDEKEKLRAAPEDGCGMPLRHAHRSTL